VSAPWQWLAWLPPDQQLECLRDLAQAQSEDEGQLAYVLWRGRARMMHDGALTRAAIAFGRTDPPSLRRYSRRAAQA